MQNFTNEHTSLLQHLALVLHQQLHPLDGGGGRLGHAGRHAREHEVLEETQLRLLLVRHLVVGCSCPGVLQIIASLNRRKRPYQA